MLNKITAHVYVKSEIEKAESEKGTTYYKMFCTSKSPSGKGYIPYSFTIWGNRFDKLIPLLQRDKPIYIEADLQQPQAYINKNGQPAVSFQAYITKIELLPREKTISENEEELLPVEQEIPF